MRHPHRPTARVLRTLGMLAFTAALSACGDEGTGARPPEASEAESEPVGGASVTGLAGKPVLGLAEGLDLPEVGTIGDLPAESTRVVVQVDRDGGLYVNGVSTAETDLPQRVRKHGLGRDRTDLLLAIDRSVPWAATDRVLMHAAGVLATERVLFLVAPEGGGAPGALATFRPGRHESCCAPPANADSVRVGVALYDGPPTDPRALLAALGALPAATRDLRVRLPIQALVPTGEALRVVDVVLRAGYAWVGFETVEGDDVKGTIRELVARGRAAKGAVRLSLNDEVLPSSPVSGSALPVVARVVGRPAGGWWPIEPTPPGPSAAVNEAPTSGDGIEIEEDVPAADPSPIPTPPRPTPIPRAGPKRPRQPLGVVERALEWLSLHQSPDGRFEAQGFAGWCGGERWTGPRPGGAGLSARDVETTSLGLLAFQCAGWSRRSPGPFGTVVRSALSWLVARQDEDGCLSDRADPLFLRDHALATLVLAHSYRTTGSSVTRMPLGRALAFSMTARNPGGGWGRSVRSGDTDVVTTAWMAAAWTEAGLASASAVDAKRDSVPLDAAALAEAREAILAVTDPRTGRVMGAPDDPRLDVLSPAAWTVRRLAGEDPKGEPLASASARLFDALPSREGGRAFDPLVVWFGTLVAYERGGDLWKAWELALKDAVIATQATKGDPCEAVGSWDPVGPSVLEGGRVAGTALLALASEVYYRYDRVTGLLPAR